MQRSTPGPEVVSAPPTPRFTPLGAAYFGLAVLFSMNLLNYVDRYVFNQLGHTIQQKLHFSDIQFGVLSTSFMVVYTIVSPVMGWLGDRYNRRILLAVGVGLWSVATVGTAFSNSFAQMFFWRALLGVGEASYGVIAPPLLADLFSPRHRGRVMGVFYLALPLGGALGFGIGGWVGMHYGWQYAFWVVGLPGLVAASLALLIKDPGRGASEGHTPAGKAERPTFRDYLGLFRTPSFFYNVAGLTCVTFVIGAYAAWGSIFYQRVHQLDEDQAGYWIGLTIATTGILGITLGIWVADLLLKFTRRAYLLWPFIAVTAAIPFGLVALLDPEWRSSLALMSIPMVLMASVLGPCNTVTANVVPARERAAGYAVSIFVTHLLGDILSPNLIGFLSVFLGRPTIAGSPLGRVLRVIGAVPVESPTGPTNLTAGLLSIVPVLVLGSLFFLFGSRHLAADQERTRHQGGPAPEGVMVH